jgi:hypothetical protein
MPRKVKKTTRSKSVTKPTREEVAHTIRRHHTRIARHIHGVLRDAGLKGVKVHSLRFAVASNAFSGPGCVPPCPPGQTCIVDSSGGTVQWRCD